MTAKESAIYLRISVKVVYSSVARGDLKAATVGGRRSIRLKREWLDAFMEASVPKAARS
jgi:excisionase family DNA binding protein